ncbi:ABC transporter ATP-binding protein [Xanthobacter oligotrophicus]|uniref:ABC transporter ATP-binding protein n=1 Tax=Xanthobacter oligotrophicus TaxID=2607286 RepID=UPI0011F17C71|nr:ABC transporter ATP-binding protein [Xanthobacter oligotrophicus]MCG5237963.1 ABC transporter ATP-binding protein [Xanthobacter oligotrophicus]
MLSVKGLCAGYGALTILKGIDISIGSGEVVGLVGANGAGKTTLVRALAGLLPAQGGEIRLRGEDITRIPPHRRSGFGLAVVLENRNLFGELTVRENLVLAERAGRSRRHVFTLERIVDLFPAVGDKLNVRCDLLSGGQQQQVAISRALLLQPDVVVMDEPSTGLAPKVVKDILDVLGRLRADGMSIILVEQNIAIASSATNRAYVMATGRVAHEIPEGDWPRFMADEKLVSAYLGQHHGAEPGSP